MVGWLLLVRYLLPTIRSDKLTVRSNDHSQRQILDLAFHLSDVQFVLVLGVEGGGDWYKVLEAGEDFTVCGISGDAVERLKERLRILLARTLTLEFDIPVESRSAWRSDPINISLTQYTSPITAASLAIPARPPGVYKHVLFNALIFTAVNLAPHSLYKHSHRYTDFSSLVYTPYCKGLLRLA